MWLYVHAYVRKVGTYGLDRVRWGSKTVTPSMLHCMDYVDCTCGVKMMYWGVLGV